MGLDFYSGQLVRYYSHDWETIIQKAAKANNLEVQMIRQNAEDIPIDVIISTVSNWQRAIERELHVQVWNENSTLSYDTDKPDWNTYGSLLLWAIHIINSKTSFQLEKEWTKSRLYTEFLTNKKKYTRYAHLLPDTELWLPIKTQNVINWVDPWNNPMQIGSIEGLFNELLDINDATWKAKEEIIFSWRREIDPNNQNPEYQAKFAFSIIYHLAKFSKENKVPLKMDY